MNAVYVHFIDGVLPNVEFYRDCVVSSTITTHLRTRVRRTIQFHDSFDLSHTLKTVINDGSRTLFQILPNRMEECGAAQAPPVVGARAPIIDVANPR